MYRSNFNLISLNPARLYTNYFNFFFIYLLFEFTTIEKIYALLEKLFMTINLLLHSYKEFKFMTIYCP